MLKIWVGLLSIILFGLMVGSADRAIDKIQEARIVETAKEMVENNDWLIPHYNGELRLQKPPLTYWTTALSYKLFGISEGAARVPSALFALFSAGLLFMWLKQTLNVQVAANAVLVLCTSFLGMRYFRSAEADATLLFFILLACYSAYQFLELPSKKKLYLLMLALGLGFLTKGPAAIAIPMLTLFIFAAWKKQLGVVKLLAQPVGLLIFFFSAFAWYVWIIYSMPDAAQQFFSKQVDETFISGTHKQPIYWYLAHAIDFFAPWSLLIIPAGLWCYQHRPIPKLVHFALIWLLVVFVLLTFTVNKQTQYALLFSPSLAIIVGYYMEVAKGRFAQFNRIVFWLLVVAVMVLIAVGIHKQGLEKILTIPTVLIWPLLLLLPWAFNKVLNISAPNLPVILAATFASFIFLYGQAYIAKDEEKDDIKQLVQLVIKTPTVYQNLYQVMPGDGAISFYANRPIKPLDHQRMQALLATHQSFWLFSKDKPDLKNGVVEEEKKVGHWSLWKVTAH